MNDIDKEQQKFFESVFSRYHKDQVRNFVQEMRGVFPTEVEANALRAFADMPWNDDGVFCWNR